MTNEQLAAAIQAGDRDLILPLWFQVGNYVRKMAYKWQRNGVDVEDLMQCGFIALLGALDGWDGDKGSVLSWYTIHLKAAFTEATGRRTQRQKMDPIHNAMSLDAPLVDSEGDPLVLVDVVPDPAAEAAIDHVADADAWERLHNALETALESLTEPQRAIIRARFWRGATLEQAAAECGITRSEAQKLEAAALRHLRHPKNSHALREYRP